MCEFKISPLESPFASVVHRKIIQSLSLPFPHLFLLFKLPGPRAERYNFVINMRLAVRYTKARIPYFDKGLKQDLLKDSYESNKDRTFNRVQKLSLLLGGDNSNRYHPLLFSPLRINS